AAQFESFLYPFLIMFSLPLALTGGVLGLFVTGETITVVALMGFIMLVGMVVNNAIVLVDYTNQLRERGMGCEEALLEAGPTRLRPILMTTLTTVIGMIPMAVAVSEGTEMQKPMAIVIIFGMVISTLVTLIFVPVLYSSVPVISLLRLQR
ncbi:MAG TPA: efflux RND transporter permease subunit, partial [Candidatus Bacteroides intestinigallinarum]|nr:efflux RND transporter permease subunit [Candidatus Bacteroides intestinigallinarum]